MRPQRVLRCPTDALSSVILGNVNGPAQSSNSETATNELCTAKATWVLCNMPWAVAECFFLRWQNTLRFLVQTNTSLNCPIEIFCVNKYILHIATGIESWQ